MQVLLSAIGSAKSLSDKKTVELMKKLYELLGTTEAEQLQGIISVASKRNNERVYYSIDAITTAIMKCTQKLDKTYGDAFFMPRSKIYIKHK